MNLLTLFWFNTTYQELLVEKLAHMTCEFKQGEGWRRRKVFVSESGVVITVAFCKF